MALFVNRHPFKALAALTKEFRALTTFQKLAVILLSLNLLVSWGAYLKADDAYSAARLAEDSASDASANAETAAQNAEEAMTKAEEAVDAINSNCH